MMSHAEHRQNDLRQNADVIDALRQGLSHSERRSLANHLAGQLRERRQRSLDGRINRVQPQQRRHSHHQRGRGAGQKCNALAQIQVRQCFVHRMRDLSVRTLADTSIAGNRRSRSRRSRREFRKPRVAWNAPLSTRNSPMNPFSSGNPTEASTTNRKNAGVHRHGASPGRRIRKSRRCDGARTECRPA